METTTVCFANSFWGLEEAGVESLLSRLADAKSTNEKIRLFFKERALIEDEYSRRLARLAKSCALGESEVGSLKISLDAVTMETLTMADIHAQSADRMKKDLDDAHTTFASSMRDDRKRIQANSERLFKIKITQQNDVAKHRDRYEADCRKINGFIAQQNLLLGRELDKNNMKLEKAQAALVSSQSDYKKAVKLLNDTTDKWNRDWINACDKFQDLEEDRIERIKTSLWSYANMVSQTCVSDDESCEKIRLSLEKCDVHKDIRHIIDIKGTGNEIPDAPDFCDFRSTTREVGRPSFRVARHVRSSRGAGHPSSPANNSHCYQDSTTNLSKSSLGTNHSRGGSPTSNINTYPLDGITQLCRSDSAATGTSVATSVAASHLTASSMYSSIPGSLQHTPATSISSPFNPPQIDPPTQTRRKSFMERAEINWPSRRSPSPLKVDAMKPIKAQRTGGSMFDALRPARSRSRADLRANSDVSQEPISVEQDFRTAKMLNIGQNVLPVMARAEENMHEGQYARDPIAEALAKLKFGSREQSSNDLKHMTVARTAAVGDPISSRTGMRRSISVSPAHQPIDRTTQMSVGQDESYHASRNRDTLEERSRSSGHLGELFVDSTDQPLNALYNDPALNGTQNHELSANRIECKTTGEQQPSRPRSQHAPGDLRRSPSPLAVIDSGIQNPSMNHTIPNGAPQSSGRSSPSRQTISPDALYHSHNSYHNKSTRAKSNSRMDNRPNSPISQTGSSPSRLTVHSNTSRGRISVTAGQVSDRSKIDRSAPNSSSPRPSFGDARYDPTRGRDGHAGENNTIMNDQTRSRSRSSAEMSTVRRTFAADGREILRVVEALYDYQAAIPEEIGFCAGDNVAVVEMRQDGWWLGEVIGIKHPRRGLIPSNFFRSLT